jgi:hypothetical protein
VQVLVERCTLQLHCREQVGLLLLPLPLLPLPLLLLLSPCR